MQMNCSYEQCAPINEAQCWSNIDWKAAKRYVGSLQARIVKAVKQGRKGKVFNNLYCFESYGTYRSIEISKKVLKLQLVSSDDQLENL